MRVIDADGHVEENVVTFSDKYFDPAFRAQRPQVVPGSEEGLAYWMIEEQRVETHHGIDFGRLHLGDSGHFADRPYTRGLGDRQR